jgi:aspartyl-tRNA(Asn)/glutamyl-tRNA(Gln) amidotransferase subunit B
LPPIDLDQKILDKISKNIPELPLAKVNRYRKEYGLNENDSLKLAESLPLSSFYEQAVELSGDAQKSANFILTEVLRKSGWAETPVTPQHIADVLKLLKEGTISASGAKTILQTALKKDKTAHELMKDLGLEQNSDTGQLEEWVDQVLKDNAQSVEDFKNGKDKALQFLMGQVMKLSRGSANPPLVMKMLHEKIAKL